MNENNKARIFIFGYQRYITIIHILYIHSYFRVRIKTQHIYVSTIYQILAPQDPATFFLLNRIPKGRHR